jgi:GNAT superfamily N-acetyltransferase
METCTAFHIIPAGPGDAAALAQVHVRAWREIYVGLLPASFLTGMNEAAYTRRWRAALMAPEPPETVLCAEGATGLVAYGAGSVANGRAQVSTLYVVRSAQGRGLGKALLGSLARVFATRGATSLRLWVLNGNEPAHRFYDRLGGAPGAARTVGGWGGHHRETAFDWPDIRVLIGFAPPPPG